MTRIPQLADIIEVPQDLSDLIRAGVRDFSIWGRVKVVEHDGLLLFDYKDECQYDGGWNKFELFSRGLIMDTLTGEIVARPFDKFFNWGQDGRTSTADVVSITEKMDGSLGIVFMHPHTQEIHVSTRGSFTSEQAVWATEWLRNHLSKLHITTEQIKEALWYFPAKTLSVEIIYPENRVVVDYEGKSGLVLLAVRHICDGTYLPDHEMRAIGDHLALGLPHPYLSYFAEIASGSTKSAVASVIAWASSKLVTAKNKEGVVVEFADGQRFKFKTDWYIQLHRIVTGLNKKRIYEAVRDGLYDDLRATIPDEFATEVEEWADDAEHQFNDLRDRCVTIWCDLARQAGPTRKDAALWMKAELHPSVHAMVWAMYDGDTNKQHATIWRYIMNDL